jgi:Sugar phosphate isomerases/epimerases
MSDWAVGLSTGCFYRTNILECLQPIRESGFSMIEVCSSPSHLDYHDLAAVHRAAGRISELGMTAHSFHAPFADHIDISALEKQRREESLREIFQAVEAAAVLRVSYFVIHPGPEHATPPLPHERQQRMENVVESLNRVAHRCRSLGLACVLENKLPHLLFGNTGDILQILEALDAVEAGVCLDTGHAHLSGDISHLLRKLSGHVRILHVHDNRRNYDDHLPPGDGMIDWKSLLHQLTREGFHGALILEIAATSETAHTLENARRGRAHLREVSRQILREKLARDAAAARRPAPPK